jgi:hypothetical protein
LHCPIKYKDDYIKDDMNWTFSTSVDKFIYSLLGGGGGGLNRPFARPRCTWKDNNKQNIMKIRCGLDSTGEEYRPVMGSSEHDDKTFILIPYQRVIS